MHNAILGHTLIDFAKTVEELGDKGGHGDMA